MVGPIEKISALVAPKEAVLIPFYWYDPIRRVWNPSDGAWGVPSGTKIEKEPES